MGAIENMLAYFTNVNNLFMFVILIFGGMIAAIGLIFMLKKLIDAKYPPVTFLVITRETSFFITQRLVGDMVSNVGILDLFMGKYDVGEDIKAFKRMRNLSGLMSGPIYLATMTKEALIPLDIYFDRKDSETGEIQPYILPEAIVEGKRVARRYMAAIEMARNMAKIQEPLIASVLTILPLALILAVYLLGTFWAFSFIASVISEASTQLAEASRILSEVAATKAADGVVIDVGGGGG